MCELLGSNHRYWVKGRVHERFWGSQLEDCNVCWRHFTTGKNYGRHVKSVKKIRAKKLFGIEKRKV